VPGYSMRKLRLLYLDSVCLGDATRLAMQAYYSRGFELIWNLRQWHADDHVRFSNVLADFGIEPAHVDEASGLSVANALVGGNKQVDIVVLPPDSPGPDSSVMEAFEVYAASGRLKAIGCPNDSLRHLRIYHPLSSFSLCPVISTSNVHARSVAEYTICHFLWHARRMGNLRIEKNAPVEWRHQEAVSTTRLLRDRTLAVLGGSGRDGSAVITLARTFDMNIRALGAGSLRSNEELRRQGAVVADDYVSLLKGAEFVSINCRLSDTTENLIGEEALSGLSAGAIIVNPAGAEVMAKSALVNALTYDPSRRKLDAVILDMPYGGGRGIDALNVDPTNRELLDLGVTFTPRIAGYTQDSRLEAEIQLADRLSNAVAQSSPAEVSSIELDCYTAPIWQRLLSELKSCISRIGRQLLTNRIEDVRVVYKSDGSLATANDIWVEQEVAAHLRNHGFVFRLLGEEIQEPLRPEHQFELVIDGIDGTRNFRDGNYGWCISAAVKYKEATILAVIFDPVCDEMYFADMSGGSRVIARGRESSLTIPSILPNDFSFSIGSFRIQGSRTIKENISNDIKEVGGRGREWGSVALSICGVARGGLGVFVQGSSKEYDHIAAVFIAELAGAMIFRQPASAVGELDIIVSHPSIFTLVESSFIKHARTG
jgi:myo-inositol-1(or 4)-monophosphatase